MANITDLSNNDGAPDAHVNLSGGQVVSMQVVQQVYRDVTGKSERLTRQFTHNHRTSFADLENLNARIEQLLEQYNIRERVCTVTLFHSDDYSERFSSFDRARAYDSGSTSPVENVRIEYNFLIVLPVTNKPQSFKVTVDVHSVAALFEKLREGSQIQRRLASAFTTSSGSLSIEYVDYAVARTILVAISQWFDGLDARPTPKFFKFAKRYNHHLDWIFKYSTAVVTALTFFLNAPEIAGADWSSALRYGIAAFVAIFVLSGVAYQLGSALELAIDEYQCMSHLSLNKGDDRLIEKVGRQSWLWLLRGGLSIVGAVGINIFATWLAVRVGLSQ